MAVDRNLKKKKKREQKRTERRQAKGRRSRRAKLEEYSWYASKHYYSEKYRIAFNWAMKGLKLHPGHEVSYGIALRSSEALEDDSMILTVLRHGWKHDLISSKQQLYVLGTLAFKQGDYGLAKESFDTLFQDPASLYGRFLKRDQKAAQRCLEFCRDRERLELAERSNSSKRSSAKKAGEKGQEKAPAAAAEPSLSEETKKREAAKEQAEDIPDLEIVYEIDGEPVLRAISEHRTSDAAMMDLALSAYKLSFRASYDQLICLPTTNNVQSLWYQEESARKIMKTFRGRAILADEVGLGKTIEACLVLKEYVLRGLVRSALVLTPSSLVNQWQEELQEKFGLCFVTSNDPVFREDPDRFWKEPFLLVSIHTAKGKRHFDAATARTYDMVIVDEAHHLKNRSTLNWKLVNAIQKTFLLLVTATPVQNKLEELYNLVTLLKPGHLKTLKAFKDEFVARGNPTDPKNREKLRHLLKEVMIRNTRSVTQLHIPPRFASTIRIDPSPDEETFYQEISRFVTEQAAQGSSALSKMALRRLLEAAGSSHFASLKMLEKISLQSLEGTSNQAKDLLEMGRSIRIGGKIRRVIELLQASPEQKIVFVNYLATLEYFHQILEKHKMPHVVYRGGMTTAQKQQSIRTFQEGCPILLSTDTGGEGHNLQFCHVMINCDLPWNPMQIEQRIGRIHRIGQKNEVQLYNFCSAGSLEDYMLEILDRKINMFELVVGEIDMILGRLKGEREFSDLVYELWVKHPDETERQKAFNALGSRLKRARTSHEKSKDLDEKLFQEDFGV
ncbi:MAG: SNF2-related protein [Thermodesulfobacteriota bacterium]|nr:SNF2-related protein [Thermodesulfobacteriota bacterium]